jgi:hypothetical protein
LRRAASDSDTPSRSASAAISAWSGSAHLSESVRSNRLRLIPAESGIQNIPATHPKVSEQTAPETGRGPAATLGRAPVCRMALEFQPDRLDRSPAAETPLQDSLSKAAAGLTIVAKIFITEPRQIWKATRSAGPRNAPVKDFQAAAHKKIAPRRA